ncbi:MBL fold metallo-hydrolase [Candidatus Gracilibacteria bacterium]|jgi:L-ascorbate metabolism protein UlaG (beta-lactamase superfamily)|nr:MBL fold metallo-hydrolase [Candidatus Gracilibacteria bacterium]
MEIIWKGNSSFEVKGKNASVAVDSGEIGVLESGKSFTWPGEYEVKGVPISTITAWTKSKSKEETEGAKGDETLIIDFVVDGIRCCHLGKLGHILPSDVVNKIGDVDVLMIEFGAGTNLDNKKAIEIIESIEPRSVLAMGKNANAVAFKEIGAEGVVPQNKFVIKSQSELPEDKRVYVLLSND